MHFHTDHFLESLLWENEDDLGKKIITHPDEYRLQIIYVQINRDSLNLPAFREFHFHVNPDFYFYPASTVKMPIALAALEKIRQINLPGLTKYTPMFTAGLPAGTSAVTEDPTALNGKPSVAQYIKKIFLVSDNDAANRLYEFVGQQQLNESLHLKGYKKTDILHRLDISLSPELNRRTNSITFCENEKVIYFQPEIYNADPYPQRQDFIGKKYLANGKITKGSFDFSMKNRAPLDELLGLLKSVIFPASLPDKQRFSLSEEDVLFLHRYISEFPTESEHPHYDTREFPAGHGKFLMPCKEDSGEILPYLRSFGKSGWAYGFLTDVAYIVDFKNQIEFMLAATLQVDGEDLIVNSGQYDYERTGKPFLKKLGQIIYQYELMRPREYLPDLSRYSILYRN